jgi:hypothetical protein
MAANDVVARATRVLGGLRDVRVLHRPTYAEWERSRDEMLALVEKMAGIPHQLPDYPNETWLQEAADGVGALLPRDLVPCVRGYLDQGCVVTVTSLEAPYVNFAVVTGEGVLCGYICTPTGAASWRWESLVVIPSNGAAIIASVGAFRDQVYDEHYRCYEALVRAKPEDSLEAIRIAHKAYYERR